VEAEREPGLVVRYARRLLQIERASYHHAPAQAKVVVQQWENEKLEIHYRGRKIAWKEIVTLPERPVAKRLTERLRPLRPAATHPWKRHFDSVRPVTAIPFLFHGQQIRAWGGPRKGTITMDGSQWIPYQLSTFPTPPFPEFMSGHSTFSAAGAEILRLLPTATGLERQSPLLLAALLPNLDSPLNTSSLSRGQPSAKQPSRQESLAATEESILSAVTWREEPADAAWLSRHGRRLRACSMEVATQMMTITKSRIVKRLACCRRNEGKCSGSSREISDACQSS